MDPVMRILHRTNLQMISSRACLYQSRNKNRSIPSLTKMRIQTENQPPNR